MCDRCRPYCEKGHTAFFFYAGDREEPPHVHVERDNRVAQVWLEPVRLQRSGAFNRSEIRRVVAIIEGRQAELVESWNAYFGA